MKKYDVDFIQECYENFIDSELQDYICFAQYLDHKEKGADDNDIQWLMSSPKIRDKENKKQRNGFKIELNEKIYKVYFEHYNDTVVKCNIYFDIPEFDIWGLKSIGVAKIFDPEKYPDHQYSEDEINDKFDLEIGRRIAFDKALEKMISIHNREMKKFKAVFDRSVNFLDNSIEKRADKFLRTGR